MKKSNYTFEVHAYAPELNKVYLNGLNVTKYFEKIKKYFFLKFLLRVIPYEG